MSVQTADIAKRMSTAEKKDKRPLVILLGCYYLEKDIPFAKKKFYKNVVSFSNEQYEKKLLLGFLGCECDCLFLSAPSIGGWPIRNRSPFIKGFSENSFLKTTPYFSPYGLMNFFKARALASRLKKLVKPLMKECPNRHVRLIACEAHRPYLEALKSAKKRNPSIFTTLILPDLPENMIKSTGGLYSFLKKRDIKAINLLTRKWVDSFLCFTKDIQSLIVPPGKPSFVSEGIIGDAISPRPTKQEKTEQITCVFVGKTDARNGIEVILDAAKIAPPFIRFDIYGSGNMDPVLKKCPIPNVHYHGLLSPSELPEAFAKADIVLSPRKPIGNYVSYSFPSKIMDYISFGKKIVTYKLPCYFEALDDVLFYPKDYSPSSLLEAIIHANDTDSSVIFEKYERIKARYAPTEVARHILDLGPCY